MGLLTASMCFAALMWMRPSAVQGKRWFAARLAVVLVAIAAIVDVALGPTALSLLWITLLCAIWLAAIYVTRSTPARD